MRRLAVSCVPFALLVPSSANAQRVVAETFMIRMHLINRIQSFLDE
jgi:hypothetical protein